MSAIEEIARRVLSRPVSARLCARKIRQAAGRSGVPVEGLSALVITSANDAVFEERLRERLVSAEVAFVAVDANPANVLAAVMARPTPGLIVDVSRGDYRVRLARELVWILRDGGTYVAIGVGRRWSQGIEQAGRSTAADSVLRQRGRKEFADSVCEESQGFRTRTLVKRGNHHALVRHAEVEAVLAERYGEEWGQVLARQDAYEFTSRAELVMHGDPPVAEKPASIRVPQLSVREYSDATCHMREILTRENLILPDTFRHWQSKDLFHKRIQPASRSFGRLGDEVTAGQVRRQAGAFYSLDSAFPAHFGHLMTETISRYWGWKTAVQAHPGIRPVMTHQAGKAPLPQWKRDVLQALSVPVEDILFVGEGESVQVDTLVAAMPQLVNPRYIDANIQETWAQILVGIGADPAPSERPEKIFLSRRVRSQRSCTNTSEVEAFFAAQGFSIMLPEQLPFTEQVHTFARAKVIAGFGGSALFNAMFNSSATVLVLTSRSYVAANEYLIASVNGNPLHYFWAPPEIEQPRSGFSVDAYRSGFEFPVEEHRAAILGAV